MRLMLKILAGLLIAAGLAVSVFFFIKLSTEYTVFGDNAILLDKTSNVGDFIGGVVGTMFSFAGFWILILTLNDQNKSTQKERFESKFFDLLKLHRENVQEMASDGTSGRKELHDIFMQVLKCKEEIGIHFLRRKVEQIYTEDYLSEIKKAIENFNPELNLKDLAKINLAYLITFYGLGAAGRQIIHDLLENRYQLRFSDRTINYMSMKPRLDSDYYSNWCEFMNISRKGQRKRAFELVRKIRNNEKLDDYKDQHLVSFAKKHSYPSNYIKFYGGHQYKLGHYFRHLYQAFSFIDRQKFLSPEEKYFYAKTLRAQLSTHEQALLFVNSLSMLGLVWEIKSGKGRGQGLISKYNLIKNLPGQEIFGIIYKEFYPDVQYEHAQ